MKNWYFQHKISACTYNVQYRITKTLKKKKNHYITQNKKQISRQHFWKINFKNKKYPSLKQF